MIKSSLQLVVFALITVVNAMMKVLAKFVIVTIMYMMVSVRNVWIIVKIVAAVFLANFVQMDLNFRMIISVESSALKDTIPSLNLVAKSALNIVKFVIIIKLAKSANWITSCKIIKHVDQIVQKAHI